MIKVLYLFSGNSSGEDFSIENDQAFIFDLMNSFSSLPVKIEYFAIKGKGLKGYIRNLMAYRKVLKKNKYDLVHAFYGLSGLLACVQFICPVIITFLGTDITDRKNRRMSKIAMALSSFNIFVSKQLADIAKAKKSFAVLPFGVEMKKVFYPLDKNECRKKLNLPTDKVFALFSSSFSCEIKNYPLAKHAIDMVGGIDLVEMMKGYTRQEVNLLINASDLLLLTSFSEGSPQVIKEAMACNCPIVTTDVGDVHEIVGSTEGCFITSFDPEDVADKIKMAIAFGKKTSGREKIQDLNAENIARKVYSIYLKVLKRENDCCC